MFSPIHRALGVEPGDLTIDLLEQAVQAGVRESENLDWKESLYETQNPKWREEAAKDIAAMANSGGGWLVFGVRDEDDAAAGLSPVPWSGAEKQRLRQVAYAHIGPARKQ
jgi:predicted HTH transcriptional regulator